MLPVRDWQRRLQHRLGMRGALLLCFGFMWLSLGLGVLLAPAYVADLFHTHLPSWFRLTLWGVPGLLGMITALMRRRSPAGDGRKCLREKLEPAAFGLLAVAPFQRFGSYLYATVTNFGWPWLNSTVFYLAMTVTVALFAVWTESATEVAR